jgi:hypothetical protein
MPKESSEFNQLPLEIQAMIISYLPTYDIAKNVGLISKQLNELSKDSSVRISVDFNSETHQETAAHLLHFRASQISEMKLYNIPKDIQKVVIDEIGSLKNLAKFESFTDQDFKLTNQFTKKLFQLKNLKVLDMQGYFLEDSCLATIGECKHLKTLRLGLYKVSMDELKAISSLGNLTSLRLSLYLHFEPEYFEFPLVFNNQIKCSLTFFLKSFTISHLKMIISYFPNVRGLYIQPRTTFVIDSEEKIVAMHSILSRCKNLFAFQLECEVADVAKVEERFSGWMVFILKSRSLAMARRTPKLSVSSSPSKKN